MDVTGGWHDAGDYGKYVTAGACACAQLLDSPAAKWTAAVVSVANMKFTRNPQCTFL